MGYQNRDYFRDNSKTGGGGGGGNFMAAAPMCKTILFLTIAVFLAQIFLTRPATMADVQPVIDQYKAKWAEQEALYANEPLYDSEGNVIERPQPDFDPQYLVRSSPPISIVQDWLKLDIEKVFQGQIWRLVTTAFCHDRFSVWHILMNMLFLYGFGRFVEATYGSAEFLCFYLVAAVVASFAFIGLELFTGERHGAVGASGAVMAVVCVFTMWNPHHRVNIYFLFSVPMIALLVLYAIFDLHPVLLALKGTPSYTGVAHSAHLGGLLFGFLYYQNSWKLIPYWDRLTRLFGGQAKAKSRVHKTTRPNVHNNDLSDTAAASERRPKTKSDERFDEQLDEILKKITESGQNSLTEREKKILKLGSQRYRDQ